MSEITDKKLEEWQAEAESPNSWPSLMERVSCLIAEVRRQREENGVLDECNQNLVAKIEEQAKRIAEAEHTLIMSEAHMDELTAGKSVI